MDFSTVPFRLKHTRGITTVSVHIVTIVALLSSNGYSISAIRHAHSGITKLCLSTGEILVNHAIEASISAREFIWHAIITLLSWFYKVIIGC